MSDYGTNTQSIVLATLLGAIFTVVIILALVVIFHWYQDGLQTSLNISERPAKLEESLQTQEAWLIDYRITDPEKRVVAIPINRAMEVVVAELSAKEKGDE